MLFRVPGEFPLSDDASYGDGLRELKSLAAAVSKVDDADSVVRDAGRTCGKGI